MKRYDDTLPADLSLSLETPKGVNDIATKRRNFFSVPTSVTGKLSSTSNAKDCFVKRENSKKMQEMLLNYAYTVCTSAALSGDV